LSEILGVNDDFISTLGTLREFREYANYVFGMREDGKPFRDADDALIQSAGVVSDVSMVASATIGLYDQIPTLIRDNFGDDLIRGYLTREQKEHIVKKLLSLRLTT
jgi:hypothetical protein